MNTYTKVIIICPVHGEFMQTPHDHLVGGCVKCGYNKTASHKRLTTEEFIEKAKKIHGDKYDYSKVDYINNHTKVCIICPIHGEFEIVPANFLQGHGCAKCAFEINSRKRLHDINWFIENARKVHGDKYDYSEVEYKGVNKKVKIICQKCGNIFYQTPYNHISCQHGCPLCNISHLENDVEVFLKNHDINYVREYKLGRLRGDFYLSDYNLIIECQGEQHFIPKFILCKDEKKRHKLYYDGIERDIRKKRICDEKCITLLYYTKSIFLNDRVWEMGIYAKDNTFTNLEELFQKIQQLTI